MGFGHLAATGRTADLPRIELVRSRMYDTIIIGAGMSGLAAGIRLAYYDQRVCILEKHTTIGGLNSFYRLRGRDYDVGLHAVTNVTPKGPTRTARPTPAATSVEVGRLRTQSSSSVRRSLFPRSGSNSRTIWT